MFTIKEKFGEGCVKNSDCESNMCEDFGDFSWQGNDVKGFQCKLNFVINHHLEPILNINLFSF
jgi:hypothetical protein